MLGTVLTVFCMLLIDDAMETTPEGVVDSPKLSCVGARLAPDRMRLTKLDLARNGPGKLARGWKYRL